MQTFVWNPQFDTGLEEVDQQHLRLVEFINLMVNLVAAGQADDAALDKVLGELGDYASYHFDEEEGLMEEMGVDRRHVEHHQLQHSQFIDQVSQTWETRDTLEKPAEVLGEYLCTWLAAHILEEDQSMARQIALIAQGVAPAEAYRREASRA
ncbi:MAG: bacteriohemerythrin [Proteobacteria bacterium]|nr:bacteriohemerythrin [Pseudomonadota bacterium]